MAREIKISIQDGMCGLCPKCLAAQACKIRAIVRYDRDEAPYLDVQRCYDCRLCLPACPYDALTIAS